MAISLILPNDKLILSAFAAVGQAPGNANLTVHRDFVKTYGVDAYTKALSGILDNAGVTNADLANLVIANFGLSSVAAATPAFLTSYFQANAANRAAAVINLANTVSNWTGDAAYNGVRDAFNELLSTSYNYATVAANTADKAISEFSNQSHTYDLTVNMDVFTGTSGDDLFNAYIVNNSNTLQSNDTIKGGAGVDTLFADIGSSQNFAITPVTTGVEKATFRVEANGTDSGDNNVVTNGVIANNGTAEIDAQRMSGVTTWTDSNSRADLVIEDVRIADGAKTKDVTIVMDSTDPGNVDYGVYFDQLSLRNSSTGNTTLTIQIMDTGAAGAAATAATPLLNNPYDLFKLGVNGVLTPIQLDKTAVAAADTYEALLAVFQKALVGTGIAAALGANFTVTDPISNTQVTGKSIILTATSGVTITAPTGSGWYNTTNASVPPTSNIYTTYNTGTSSVTELVTSTIVLDNVGRGSTGGDLVVGGLSAGATSTSRGVERFEIEVRDNSKLQTINSTNDALREVVLTNGVTSNTDTNQGVYDKTAVNAGNLVVNGNANPISNVAGAVTVRGTSTDTSLTGLDALHHTAGFGFTDVRLIDGSAMTGKLAFTAQITQNSIAKYINKVDTANDPVADVAGVGNVNFNVKGANFLYTGGSNNDTMAVTTDTAVLTSNTLSGRHDFTINLNGGAGDDSITHTINAGLGTNNAWVVDQKQNANITIDGGEGNDTVTTIGGGATKVTTGAGNDTVYLDKSGTIGAVWAINDTMLQPQTNLQTNGAVTGFLYNGKVTVSFSGAGGAGLGGGVTSGAADSTAGTTADPYTNGFEVTVNIPTTTNYTVTQLTLNQAIKAAINDNAVLSKLLVAEDAPANTLTIRSLIDGTFNNNDLKITVSAADLTTLGSADQTAALTAYRAFVGNSTATIAQAVAAEAAAVTNFNAVSGMDATAHLAMSAASGISIVTNVTTQGVTAVQEVQTVGVTGVVGAGAATTLLGVDFKAAATPIKVVAGDTAGVVAAKIADPANLAAIQAANANIASISATGSTLTITYTAAAGNVAEAGAAAPADGITIGAATQVTQGVLGVKEVFTATVTGTAAALETITFDGETSAGLAAGAASGQVAALLGAAGNVYGAGVAAGNVITFTANAAGALADVTATSFTSSVAVPANGTISANESDNSVDLGAGTSDVAVLGTGALSNDTVIVTGYDLGKKTIVNFTAAVGTNQDTVNFKAYLVDQNVVNGVGSPTAVDYVRIATNLNADANVDANSVTVLTPVFTATQTFAGLTANALLAAVNASNTAYAGLTNATLDAINTYTAAQLVGGTGHAIVLVQNDTNLGEYAAFELTFNGTATNTTKDFSAAKLIGYFDFGNTVAFGNAGVLA